MAVYKLGLPSTTVAPVWKRHAVIVALHPSISIKGYAVLCLMRTSQMSDKQ